MTNENDQTSAADNPPSPQIDDRPAGISTPASTEVTAQQPHPGYTVSRRAVSSVGAVLVAVALFGSGFAAGSWHESGHHHGHYRYSAQSMARRPDSGGRFGPNETTPFSNPQQRPPGNQQTPNRQRGGMPPQIDHASALGDAVL